MPKTALVVIDGQERTVHELRARDNAAWRKKFEETAEPLLGLLAQVPDVQINGVADLVALARQYGPTLLEQSGQIYALCCAYDPQFEAAYESECAAALPALLGLAFPFGSLLGMVASPLGSTSAPTMPNSPSPSGIDGTTN